MYEVKKSMPVPPGAGRRPKYPFCKMKVGEHFEVGPFRRNADNVRAAVQYYRKTASGYKKRFAVHRCGDNLYRCWRIE